MLLTRLSTEHHAKLWHGLMKQLHECGVQCLFPLAGCQPLSG
jgi:hypothetical protein